MICQRTGFADPTIGLGRTLSLGESGAKSSGKDSDLHGLTSVSLTSRPVRDHLALALARR
jgi:hypothetical protein